MELIGNLSVGFGAAATTANIGFALLGCLIGTLVGVLPGLGPVATIAMLLPLTFGLPPLTSLVMLAGIYYGSQYGGSTTAILINMPGETSSVVTCIDGHQMARNGRAGSALAVAAIGSFFAGSVATLIVAAIGPVLGELSLQFRGPEYFALMTFGLTATIILAHGSALKALAMVFLGLLFGMVGIDITSGTERFTFGFIQLTDRIDFVPLAMGVFGIAEVLANLERHPEARKVITAKIKDLLPNREEFRLAWPAVLRGTGIGSLLGILPGGGALLGSFAAYTLEKKVARDPSRFGKGAVEGVAGPESANNAGAQTAFVTLLTLGLPSNPVMALMMAAMIVHGIAPGTSIIQDQPILFWGLIASMWIGNLMLLVINLPLIGVWVKLLDVPYRLLFPAILVFCCIGVYSVDYSTFAIKLLIVFTLLGYLFGKLKCEGAPFLLGFILGPPMEEALRRSLLLSRGDPMIFLERPISAILLAFALGLALLIVLPNFRKTRGQAFSE